MDRNLSSRPSLDHLRGQAKQLLADLRQGKTDAALEFQTHLPAAAQLSPEQILAAPFKLADAQSVIARRCSQASWARLVRYVEQLRALEGTWHFASLEVDAAALPGAMLVGSSIVIHGDRFRTITPEAIYDGLFDIDVSVVPHRIDIDFKAGPEAGKSSYGLFRFDDDRLVICLGLAGVGRPTKFETRPGSGHALEVLVRASAQSEIPERTTQDNDSLQAARAEVDTAAFQAITPEVKALQGDWRALSIVRDGSPLPSSYLSVARREMRGTRTTVKMGPQTILDAWTRFDTSAAPMRVDYLHIGGATPGVLQHGIARMQADEVEFCMAPPGAARPAEFTSEAGGGWLLSRWKRRC